VSGVDRQAGLMVIKPSGVAYQGMTAADLVPVSLSDGKVLEGTLRPSSDTPTHLELYRAFPCGGIAHSHSDFATACAQARVPVECLGTTHADYFRGDVPVTRPMTNEEVEADYEANTALTIIETFRVKQISPEEVPGVLVANHGPFTWGKSAAAAVERANVLEYLARVNCIASLVSSKTVAPAHYLIDKHFFRKHGKDAYYGQK
jgi:L-ribulose-5-phosphate 4-epimerase